MDMDNMDMDIIVNMLVDKLVDKYLLDKRTELVVMYTGVCGCWGGDVYIGLWGCWDGDVYSELFGKRGSDAYTGYCNYWGDNGMFIISGLKNERASLWLLRFLLPTLSVFSFLFSLVSNYNNKNLYVL